MVAVNVYDHPEVITHVAMTVNGTKRNLTVVSRGKVRSYQSGVVKD
jgi:hypothetical protein